MRNSYGVRAQAHDSTGRFAQAATDWGRVVELTPPPERVSFQFYRAFARIRAGEVESGVAELDAIFGAATWAASRYYDFAAAFAVAASTSPAGQEKYAARAVELLRHADKPGFRDMKQIKSDPDLGPLRDRDDFKALVDEFGVKPLPKK